MLTLRPTRETRCEMRPPLGAAWGTVLNVVVSGCLVTFRDRLPRHAASENNEKRHLDLCTDLHCNVIHNSKNMK